MEIPLINGEQVRVWVGQDTGGFGGFRRERVRVSRILGGKKGAF